MKITPCFATFRLKRLATSRALYAWIFRSTSTESMPDVWMKIAHHRVLNSPGFPVKTTTRTIRYRASLLLTLNLDPFRRASLVQWT